MIITALLTAALITLNIPLFEDVSLTQNKTTANESSQIAIIENQEETIETKNSPSTSDENHEGIIKGILGGLATLGTMYFITKLINKKLQRKIEQKNIEVEKNGRKKRISKRSRKTRK